MERQKTVMIAGNSEEFCRELTVALKQTGDFQVMGTANDGEKTIQMVKAQKPDLLVLDILLPKFDGLSVLKAIANMDHRPAVVCVSAFITDYVASAAANLGARFLKLSPCDTSELVACLLEIADENNPAISIPQENINLEIMVANIIHEIGVPASLRGYQYMKQAIMLAVEDLERIHNLTESIYAPIADRLATTPGRVRKNIAHAIKVAWDRGDLDTLQRFFGYTVSNTKGKPTNTEFIAIIAEKLRIQLKKVASTE